MVKQFLHLIAYFGFSFYPLIKAMEIAGVVSRPVIPLYGAGVDTQFLNSSPCGLFVDGGKRLSGELGLSINGGSRVSLRPRKFFGYSSSWYSDSGHLEYYVSPKSRGKEMDKEKKEKSSEMKTVKKKLKLIKRLSRDLSMFPDMAFGVENENTLIGEVKGKNVSEAMEVLLAQLQQLRSEQKELKRKYKEKKVELKAGLIRANKAKCKSGSSSSSSSESSDSECREVIEMSRMRSDAMKHTKDDDEPLQAIQEATLPKRSSLIQQEHSKEVLGIAEFNLQNFTEGGCSSTGSGDRWSNSHSCSIAAAVGASRIEVCMGGKCKKMGAPAILEEFKSKIGVEGAVGGCKCMGKCRDGPNVRVLNHQHGIEAERAEGSVKPSASPLCIGVGLEDVGLIVANFLGEDRNDQHLMAHA